MITFVLGILCLVLGYLFYGKLMERIFAPDGRVTPAVAKADGMDYIVMPSWKVFMVQFLNIAGTGPIFGAIMGAKFGPAAYLWIVLGCIFAGAVHDYFSGMLSMRNDGAGLPEIVGKYLGENVKKVMLVFTVLLLILVGAVFVKSPADILSNIWGSGLMWIIIIISYYLIATILPVDKIIGKIYPVFAFALLFMALSLMIVLLVRWYDLPEIWESGALSNFGKRQSSGFDDIFPALFITIACGAISGFHATQSPMMARCMKSEKLGRPIFYGAMITEGIVAMIWATVSMWFFYGEPSGYETIAAATAGYSTSAPNVVNLVCNSWLGTFGGILALLGVVAAPITTGDTALRSARLIIAERLHLEQKGVGKRLLISIPLFAVTALVLIWQIKNKDGFAVIWSYFGWANQTLAIFTLWAITVYLAQEKKQFLVTLVPALFMTAVCTSYLFISKNALGLNPVIGYVVGVSCSAVLLVLFLRWKSLKVKNTL